MITDVPSIIRSAVQHLKERWQNIGQQGVWDRQRCVLTIVGNDAYTFLQGIATCDIKDASKGWVHTFFLTPQGKIIGDGMLHALPAYDGFLLDCSVIHYPEIEKHFQRYKLASNVVITRRDDWYTIIASTRSWGSSGDVVPPFQDPRALCCPVYRWIASRKVEEGSPECIAIWEGIRIVSCVADGESLVSGRDFPWFFAQEQSLCHTKGCFVGQEVCARFRAKGRSQRRLYVVGTPEKRDLSVGQKLTNQDGYIIGELRSCWCHLGLALLPVGTQYAFLEEKNGAHVDCFSPASL